MGDRAWLEEDGRVRAGWRILFFLALLFPMYLAGQYAASILPRSPLGWFNYILLTAAGLLAGWTMLARFDGRSPGALGFALTRSTARELLVGFAFGSALIAAATLLLLATGGARFVPDSGSAAGYASTLAWTLGYFGLAAAYEEIWFRGYAFQALVEGIGVWPAVLLSSGLFAFFHLGNPEIDAIGVANIFLAGVLLAFAYLRTRSLWFATALHAGWNWTMATALGFPVSGLVLMDTPLYDALETGSDWWTGGPFGPEAGLAGTILLLGGLAWLLRTRALREPDEVRALRPLVDSRLLESAS